MDLWSLQHAGIAAYGLVFLWLFVESTGFPLTDEPVLLAAGALVALHQVDLVAVVACALLGKVSASCLAYAVARGIREESRLALALASAGERARGALARSLRTSRPAGWLFRRASRLNSRLAPLSPRASVLRRTDGFFARYGVWAVFLGRLVPIVRSFISYPAGAARMPFGAFLVATSAGSFLWIGIWVLLGIGAGYSSATLLGRLGPVEWIAAGGVLALAVMAGGGWRWARRANRLPTHRRAAEGMGASEHAGPAEDDA